MAQTVSFNGGTFSIPDPTDEGWGQATTDYLVALAQGLAPTASGFTLLPDSGELDLGTQAGLRVLYVRSETDPTASGGFARLANNQAISWRNADDTADIPLTVDANGQLTLSGAALGFSEQVLILGEDGITVTSGTNTATVAGFRDEFVSASGSLQSAIDASISDAIVAGSSNITVTSGSNTTTIDLGDPVVVSTVSGSDGALSIPSDVTGVEVLRAEDGAFSSSLTSNSSDVITADGAVSFSGSVSHGGNDINNIGTVSFTTATGTDANLIGDISSVDANHSGVIQVGPDNTDLFTVYGGSFVNDTDLSSTNETHFHFGSSGDLAGEQTSVMNIFSSGDLSGAKSSILQLHSQSTGSTAGFILRLESEDANTDFIHAEDASESEVFRVDYDGTISGSNVEVSETVSAQNVDASTSLTVSGVAPRIEVRGDQYIFGAPDINLDGTETVYLAQGNFDSNEANAQFRMYPLRVVGMKSQTGGSPGSSNSYTFTLRKNNVDTEIEAVQSDSETAAEDSGSVIFADNDILSVRAQAAGPASNTGSAYVVLLLENQEEVA